MNSKLLPWLPTIAILLLVVTVPFGIGARAQGAKSDSIRDVLLKYEKQAVYLSGTPISNGKVTLNAVGDDYIAVDVPTTGMGETVLYYLPISKITGIRPDSHYVQINFN